MNTEKYIAEYIDKHNHWGVKHPDGDYIAIGMLRGDAEFTAEAFNKAKEVQ